MGTALAHMLRADADRGYRAFRRCGLSMASRECVFMHLVGNLTKLYQHQRVQSAACA